MGCRSPFGSALARQAKSQPTPSRFLHNQRYVIWAPPRKLFDRGEDLVEDDCEHEDKINSQRPEQNHFGTRELTAGTVQFFFGRDELIGFEGGDDGAQVDRGRVGVIFHIELLSALQDFLSPPGLTFFCFLRVEFF
jgi:hypothetical protein